MYMTITINHTKNQSEFSNWVENGTFTHDEELISCNVNDKIIVFNDVDIEDPIVDAIVEELTEYGIDVKNTNS